MVELIAEVNTKVLKGLLENTVVITFLGDLKEGTKRILDNYRDLVDFTQPVFLVIIYFGETCNL